MTPFLGPRLLWKLAEKIFKFFEFLHRILRPRKKRREYTVVSVYWDDLGVPITLQSPINYKIAMTCNLLHPPPRIKGRAIFRARPSTNNNFLSPRPVFSGNFPQCFPFKNTKKLSPVLSCSKIGRPSFYTGGGVL